MLMDWTRQNPLLICTFAIIGLLINKIDQCDSTAYPRAIEQINHNAGAGDILNCSIDIALLLDVGANILENLDANQVTYEMSKAFLFGGLESSWIDSYNDKCDNGNVRFCLLGYNSNGVYLLENCTDTPQFLEIFYNNYGTSSAIDINDYIDSQGSNNEERSVIKTGILSTVDYLIDESMKSEKALRSKRLIISTLLDRPNTDEKNLCSYYQIINEIELTQMYHILIHFGENGTFNSTEINCFNSNNLFEIYNIDKQTYYLSDINNIIENNYNEFSTAMYNLANKFTYLYEYSARLNTIQFLTYQEVSSKLLPMFTAVNSFAQFGDLLIMVSGNVTVKDATNPPTYVPTNFPTVPPTPAPTDNPTKGPTREPTPQPTTEPTPQPTKSPTRKPTKAPKVKSRGLLGLDNNNDKVQGYENNNNNGYYWSRPQDIGEMKQNAKANNNKLSHNRVLLGEKISNQENRKEEIDRFRRILRGTTSTDVTVTSVDTSSGDSTVDSSTTSDNNEIDSAGSTSGDIYTSIPGSLYDFNTVTREFIRRPDPIYNNIEQVCIVSDGDHRVFFLGGSDNSTDEIVDYVQVYDRLTDLWILYPSMNTRRISHTCHYYNEYDNEYLFVFGGCGNYIGDTSCKYDRYQNIGGINRDTYYFTIEYLNLGKLNEGWHTLTNIELNEGRNSARGYTDEFGNIWAIGGYDGISSMKSIELLKINSDDDIDNDEIEIISNFGNLLISRAGGNIGSKVNSETGVACVVIVGGKFGESTMEGETPFNGLTTLDSVEYVCYPIIEILQPINYCGLITTCMNEPCSCDEVNSHCKICNQDGCTQCDINNGYWKLGFSYQCMQCQEVFGENCGFCSDFHGCQQCLNGAERTYDSECGFWYCADP